MLRKFFAMGTAMSFINITSAQDSAKTSALTINGSADLYYRYDLGQSKSNNLTSFTNSHNSFELGMASLKFDYKTTKVDMVADLGFGKRATEFSYTDEGILQAIKQLYISYSLNSWLKLTAGTWATHVGYELVDPYANRNYSMSYMFTNGPFSHTGVKAELSYKSNGFMIGVANPTDYKYVPDGLINKKFLIAQYSFTASDKFKAYVNYVGGQNVDTSKSNQFDLVLTSKLNSKFILGFNGTVNNTQVYKGNKEFNDNKSWWGSALYLNYDPLTTFGLSLREEYFSDENQLKMYGSQAEGGSIFASTLSANFKIDNFLLIPEFRIDQASSKIFTDKDKQPTKTAASVLVAAIYQF
jgi:Putative beta-barrel porin-2, OmpL-like. bbp2